MKLTVIIEKGEKELWGHIENIPHYLPVTCGRTLEEVTINLKDLLEDFIENEGQNHKEWRHLKACDFEFDFKNYIPN